MDIKYKSSKFATYSQYIAAPIVIFVFIYQINLFITTGGGSEEMPIFFLPFWFWASIVVLVNLYKVKYVEVTENNILLKSLIGDKILEYRDIEWINQNIFGSNWYILTIKYKDKITGKSNIIIVFPEMYTNKENLAIFSELNITKYIREQIIKINPGYKIEDEPSRWYIAKWMFITLIPFLLISFVFFT